MAAWILKFTLPPSELSAVGKKLEITWTFEQCWLLRRGYDSEQSIARRHRSSVKAETMKKQKPIFTCEASPLWQSVRHEFGIAFSFSFFTAVSLNNRINWSVVQVYAEGAMKFYVASLCVWLSQKPRANYRLTKLDWKEIRIDLAC